MAETLTTALRPIHKFAIVVVLLCVVLAVLFPVHVGNLGSLAAWIAGALAFLYSAVTIGTLISQRLEIERLEDHITALVIKKRDAPTLAERMAVDKEIAAARQQLRALPFYRE